MQTAIVVSNAVFRALTESSPDGIVLVDQEGHIALVRLQTEKLFGYPRGEPLGWPIEVLVPQRLDGRHRGHLPARAAPSWPTAWAQAART